MKNNKLGLYLHVPFCASKCRYCDFYSFAGTPKQMDTYLLAMSNEIIQFAKQVQHFIIDTIYFGGGTPSCLGAERLSSLLKTVYQSFSIAENVEITVECNPDSMTDSFLNTLRAEGVNRLSIGVQSTQDEILQQLGRRHTFLQAREAIYRAYEKGFTNLSVDLMYGLPNQSTEQFLQSVKQVLMLQPAHISCYGLKLEPNTPMGRENPTLPDADTQADLYLELCDRLQRAGYLHYEISNWAKPDMQSRHNQKYWTAQPYLGLGPSAHSYMFGKRFAYPADLEMFCINGMPVPEEATTNMPDWVEYLMLRLRTAEGVSEYDFCQRFSRRFTPFAAYLSGLQKSGLAIQTAEGWRLTEKGFLVSNSIICALWDAGEI